jgi:hypothetical protein
MLPQSSDRSPVTRENERQPPRKSEDVTLRALHGALRNDTSRSAFPLAALLLRHGIVGVGSVLEAKIGILDRRHGGRRALHELPFAHNDDPVARIPEELGSVRWPLLKLLCVRQTKKRRASSRLMCATALGADKPD